jgi:hypothetical protein
MNSRFFKGLERRRLRVRKPRFRAAFGKSPALATAGTNQQELDCTVVDAVANRRHLLTFAQFAKLRQSNKRDRCLTFPGNWAHRIRVHDATGRCLEHSLVLKRRQLASIILWQRQ